jgi:hypothetical protein
MIEPNPTIRPKPGILDLPRCEGAESVSAGRATVPGLGAAEARAGQVDAVADVIKVMA